tara:strand:- start:29 stop:436 length:408 start_codon:yes stop_codon:yes gene_type:complete
MNIISNSSDVSLRLIDWLVTNYSKTQNVVYEVGNKPFHLHQNYKNMLKAYSKRMFDPFRRHNRLYLEIQDGVFETTVAQLTFFKWAIDHKVIKFAHQHKEAIKINMEAHNRCDSKKKKQNKGAHIYSVNMTISFS